MASRIETLLDNILNAVYGEEVRGSIHDAIEECYSDVSTAQTNADAAASAANTAAGTAQTAASAANSAASTATAAATTATTAATNVGTAIANANNAASTANTAATAAGNAAAAAIAAAESITDDETGALVRAESVIQDAQDAYDAIMDDGTGVLALAEAAMDDLTDGLSDLSTATTSANTLITNLETAYATTNGLITDMTSALAAAQTATENAIVAVNGNADDYNPEDEGYIMGAIPAAELAQTAATAATTAATNANTEADRVDGALSDLTDLISDAETAIEDANSAATNASLRASEASDAASTATSRAIQCQTSTELANAATTRATTAAQAIEGMTIASETLTSSQTAYAQISDVGNHKHILLGIPRGEQGPGFIIKGAAYETVSALETGVTNPAVGDMYNVGSSEPYDVYRWTGNLWENQGPIGMEVDAMISSDIDTIWGNGATPSGSQLSGSGKWLDDDGLYYLVNTKVAGALGTKVDTVSGKALSTNDLTDALKTKYDGYEATLASLNSGKVNKVSMSDPNDPSREKVLSANDFTDVLLAKLNGIESTADVTAAHTDSALSTSSNNPVRNSVVTTNINNLLATDAKLTASLASEYEEKAYATGDFCIHDNQLYVCNTTLTYAEAWNSSHWTAANIVDDVVGDTADAINAKIGIGTLNTDAQTLIGAINELMTQSTTVDTALDTSSINPVRNSVIATAINGKVSKAGDTMTNDLIMSNGSKVYSVNPTIDSTLSSLASTTDQVYASARDKNDIATSLLFLRQETNGKLSTHLGTVRAVNNSNVWNEVRLDVAADGTRSVVVSDAGAWRSALGAVSKAGDTMTGNLSFNKTTPVIAMQNTEVEHNSAPSANKDVADIIHYYKGGQIAGYYITRKDSTGDAYNIMLSRNYSGSTAYDNYLRLNVSSTGVKSVTVSDPAAWRTAISAMQNDPASIELKPASTATHGGLIDFHFAGSLTDDTTTNDDYTSRIIESSTGNLKINKLNAGSNTTFQGWNDTSAEQQIGAYGGAGKIYFYSGASTSANRGIWSNNASGTSQAIMVMGQNNAATFYGTLSGNATNVTGTVLVDHGGTGHTGTQYVSSVGSIISKWDNTINLISAEYAQWGKVAQVQITFQVTSAVSSGTTSVGTMASGKKPKIESPATIGWGNNTAYKGRITTAGVVQVNGPLSANKDIIVRAVYILP